MHLTEVMPQERDAWLASQEGPQMRAVSDEEHQASIEAEREREQRKEEAVWRDSFHYRAAFSLQDAEMMAAADAAFAPLAARIGRGLSKLYWGVRSEEAAASAALKAELRAALEADFKLYTGRVPAVSVGSHKINPQHLELVTGHPNAHSLARHGGGVTNNQLMHRALTGVAPDGHAKVVKGKTILPPMSSAFHSDELLVYADQMIRNNGALKSVIAQNPGKTIVTVKPTDIGDLGVDLGRGFEKIGGSKLKPDLQGPPRLIENLRSVQATYEFNQTKKVWETITIFPSR
jgi:hypothetical protein